MVITVFLSESIKDSNKDIKLSDWFNEFYEVVQMEERYAKAIALFFDYESPLDPVSDVDERLERIQAAVGWEDEELDYFKTMVAGSYEEGDEFAQLVSAAIPDYCQYQKDVSKELRKALEAQMLDLSRQLNATKIDIKSASSEKTFERFQKLSEKVDEMSDNISKLSGKEHKNYEVLKQEVKEAFEAQQQERGGGNPVHEAQKRRGK